VPVGPGNDFIDRCVVAVREQEWRLAYPGDGFSGDLGSNHLEDNSGKGDAALDFDGTLVCYSGRVPTACFLDTAVADFPSICEGSSLGNFFLSSSLFLM